MIDENGFYTTWGRELGIALDGIMSFARNLSPREFHELTNADFNRIRDAANEWLETDRIEAAHIKRAVEMLRWHWPLKEL